MQSTGQITLTLAKSNLRGDGGQEELDRWGAHRLAMSTSSRGRVLKLDKIEGGNDVSGPEGVGQCDEVGYGSLRIVDDFLYWRSMMATQLA